MCSVEGATNNKNLRRWCKNVKTELKIKTGFTTPCGLKAK